MNDFDASLLESLTIKKRKDSPINAYRLPKTPYSARIFPIWSKTFKSNGSSDPVTAGLERTASA